MLKIFNIVRDILTHDTDSSILILLSLSGGLFVILVLYWLYNRRKFQKLTHQIPASVVKNYLDSIIQNSFALKSSLFRGGNSEIEGENPSVFPASNLPKGRVGLVKEEDEILAQKNAEIAQLRSEIQVKNNTIKDLELRPESSSEEVERQKKELVKLQGEWEALKVERDELKECLSEYEVIEDDLANLKLLQEENEQLKRMIEEMGGTPPVSLVKDSKAEVKSPRAAEVEAPAQVSPEKKAAPVAEEKYLQVEESGGGEKSEDLLQEFKKMLG